MNRKITNKINWFLDNIIPPLLRDNKFFMFPFLWIIFRDKTKHIMEFKKHSFMLTSNDFVNVYQETKDRHIKRETDLNEECVDYLLSNLSGNSVLDIACGDGYLCRKIKGLIPVVEVVGGDIITPSSKSMGIQYIETNLESTPFENDQFDTVICAHTLEHVVNIDKAILELRRIARNKLIIVLPKQRNYLFTFDLHIHFFPYKHDVINLLRPEGNYEITLVGGDWVYYETY
ncbi:class I SAM-dependent methyltransferase [Vibrio aestuarianus]|nr:class I SAM-dependent methyltransferase [Vibrio aestuarianus]